MNSSYIERKNMQPRIKTQKESMDTRKYEQALHDAVALDYDNIITSHYSLKHKYFTTAVWGKRFNKLFLDYGCGTGIASCTLADIGCKVVAFDISPKMAAITKQKCNVPVVVADAFNLPFKNQAFSTFCITGVLHYLLDWDSAFDEICRCAKDVICINEPSATPPILPVKLIHTFLQAVGSLKNRIYQKPLFSFNKGGVPLRRVSMKDRWTLIT